MDARTARVVQADHGGADLHRLVHDLANLLGMGFGQRTAEHGEILAEHEHQTAVDHAVAGHDAVAGDLGVLHAEVGTAVLDKHVPFFEGAVVQQQLDALTRGELALLVLGINALLAASQTGEFTFLLQLLEDVVSLFHACLPRFLVGTVFQLHVMWIQESRAAAHALTDLPAPPATGARRCWRPGGRWTPRRPPAAARPGPWGAAGRLV